MSIPRLCIFAKAPIAGQAKTRLARDIGEQAALAVYRCLLGHTAAVARQWPGPVQLLLSGAWPTTEPDPFATLPVAAQRGAGLGERLAAGLGEQLPAIAIGTDCPGLSLVALKDLATALDAADVAIGPARDGGYWALGVANAAALGVCCAAGLPWSQAGLLAATRCACREAGLSLILGCDMQDIDTATDLAQAERHGFVWRHPDGPSPGTTTPGAAPCSH